MTHKYKIIMSVINKQKYDESESGALCALSLNTSRSAVVRDFCPTVRTERLVFYVLLEVVFKSLAAEK